MKSRSQSGVALVITLIMLAVITIVAVAFLALSQSERASVSQTMTGTEAELMANIGLERAKAHVLADINAFFYNPTNRYTNFFLGVQQVRYPAALGPDLTVSIASTSYVDAPYEAPATGPTRNEDLRSITNLLEDPRVPVFVRTPDRDGNTNRHYLDLNRNNRFEPSGWVPLLDAFGNPNGSPPELHYAAGDPEWVGVLSRINEPHSGTNRFVGRYAYLVIPVGRTLDFNFIHNDAKQGAVPNGFYRNQGHASWELNLAAFLSDLNTNAWNPTTFRYSYGGWNSISQGYGFQDAAEVLSYRYNGAYSQLRSANDVFGGFAGIYASDGIDQYVDGLLDPISGQDNDVTARPWPGAASPHHFFTVHDLFNRNPYLRNFTNRLWLASARQSSYDRHTFYRMLSEIATDTAPEKMSDGRVNINYENYSRPFRGTPNPADFQEWGSAGFVRAVADHLFRENDFRIGPNTWLTVTNIQVWPLTNNLYTPSVHRILQMALNIYDAARSNLTWNPVTTAPYYPTVLQPEFRKTGNGIFISGFRELHEIFDDLTGERVYDAVRDPNKWRDLSDNNDVLNLKTNDFVYGVPILVAAKKGYPNFNEFFFQNEVQVERKMQIIKWPNAQRFLTNQMFLIGVSNSMGLEAWNSYSNAFPRDLRMFTAVEVQTMLTNDHPGFPRVWSWSTNMVSEYFISAGNWRGLEYLTPVPGRTNGTWTNQIALPYSVYRDHQYFPPTPITQQSWEPRFPAPNWGVTTTNRLRFFLFDNGRIVDAVGLAPLVVSTNIMAAVTNNHQFGLFWDPRRGGPITGVTTGMLNQILVSRGSQFLGYQTEWNDYLSYNTVQGGVAGFNGFLTNRNNLNQEIFQVPYTPQVKAYWRSEWRANDPLVHYVDEDLRLKRDIELRFSGVSSNASGAYQRLTNNVGQLNDEYRPWPDPMDPTSDPSKLRIADMTIKDPMIRRADDWDFPTNKFASIGELGRVHRGTPWQTIYFKSTRASTSEWAKVHSSVRAHPTNDWAVADVFTVAQHPNASRGILSVNQTNAAAWSALFSGIDLANVRGATRASPVIMQPMALGTNVLALVEAINANRTNFHGKVYSKLAQFLSTAALTTNSPYAQRPYLTAAGEQTRDAEWTDADWEAIPRSILSLVKVGEPRFLVYAFGQSLKPAQGSVLTAAGYRGLCVNYEVTGELAARAVVRVDLDWPNPTGPNRNDPPVPHAVVESFNIIPPD